MPLVFVHGVATRSGASYEKDIARKHDLFTQIALRGLVRDPTTSFPYWGGLGANPRWDHRSVPAGEYESFGPENEAEVLVQEVAGQLAESDPLLTFAREDFAGAIDLLWSLVPEDRWVPDLGELGAKAIAYAEANKSPAWLGDVSNDEQFLTALQIKVNEWQPEDAVEGSADGWESFGAGGFWDRVREGADRLRDLPGMIGTSLLIKATRSKLHATVAVFVGDIFVYLNTRDQEESENGDDTREDGDHAREDDEDAKPGPIPSVVIQALQDAHARITDDDPYLVVVGHSMGGNILYDVLTHYDTVKVDALVTVGSQVGLFEELKLFKNSDLGIPSQQQPRVARPTNVDHWINVFDRRDILSFAGDEIFEDVDDYEYSTGEGLLGAHSSYFDKPSFHRRLNERLINALQP